MSTPDMSLTTGRLTSGHFTYQLNRTYHVSTTQTKRNRTFLSFSSGSTLSAPSKAINVFEKWIASNSAKPPLDGVNRAFLGSRGQRTPRSLWGLRSIIKGFDAI